MFLIWWGPNPSYQRWLCWKFMFLQYSSQFFSKICSKLSLDFLLEYTWNRYTAFLPTQLKGFSRESHQQVCRGKTWYSRVCKCIAVGRYRWSTKHGNGCLIEYHFIVVFGMHAWVYDCLFIHITLRDPTKRLMINSQLISLNLL